MAYTGTAQQVFLTVCETGPTTSGPTNCLTWAPVPASMFVEQTNYSFDQQQVEQLITISMYIAALIFVICMIKKAIEQ